MEALDMEMDIDIYDREKAIVVQYTKLQKDISRRKHDEFVVERRFYEQLDDVEGLVLDKVAKVKKNAKERAKQVIEDNADRINELQERIKRSRDWFTSKEHDEQTLMDYERKIEEFSDAINQLKATVFSIETCHHIADFLKVCEQLVEVYSDGTEYTGRKPKWKCYQTISNKQRERQSSASLVVSGHPSINVNESFDTNATHENVSDVENAIATAPIATVTHVTQPEANDLNVAITSDIDDESNDKSCIYDIEYNCSDIIPGSDYGAIKAITVSKEGHIVVLDTDQRAYFSFDSSHRFISKNKFNLKDYPHDVEFLEEQENIVTPVTHGNVNYMLRVLSFGRNQTSFRKIGYTKLLCPMRQHCVSVRTQRNGSFVACIVCPLELRLISYDKNGRVSKIIPQCAVDINDRVIVDYLKQERYAVKLDEEATEAFVIRSDKQSLNCFRLEREKFGKTKWLFESQNMILSDLCVYGKHVFVTENANGHILEFETDFGQNIHRIDLRPFNISNPFAICIKHNQILLSQYSNSWRRGSRTVTKRKTISVLTFKDRTTV